MNKLIRSILVRICRRLVVQGPTHKTNITEYYRIMHDAAYSEFTEDNTVTLDGFLQECHSESCRQITA
jgi:hypothetical protein